MKLTNFICYAALAAGLTISTTASPAQIEREPVFAGSVQIRIKFAGPIVPEDVEKFQKVAGAALQEAKQLGLSRLQVVLDSTGGDVVAAMAIGRQIRANDMLTRVDPTCISACTFIFAAGVGRSMWFGQEKHGRQKIAFGIHRPYSTATEIVSARDADLKHKQMDAAMREYFKEMNIPDPLVDAMLRTPPESVRYLNREELEEYGLWGDDPGYAHRQATAEAREYGLTMQEYYARVRRRDAQCADQFDVNDYYCRNAVMYGISVAEAKRRDGNTEICGDDDGLTTAERKRRNECINAVWRGEQSVAPPTAAAAAAQKRKEGLTDGMAKMEAVHPGWKEIVSTAEFKKWMASSPAYDKLAKTGDANDVIALLSMYKARKNQAPAKAPATEEPLPSRAAPTKVASTPCQPDTQVRPRTGVELGSRHRGGLGELRVANGMDVDAVAVLIDNGTELPRRAIFIRSGESGAMKSVPAGRYRLRFQLGSDWTAERRFCRPRSASEFDSVFDFDEVRSDGGIKYSVHNVTLHPVPDGKARTHVVMDKGFELPPP